MPSEIDKLLGRNKEKIVKKDDFDLSETQKKLNKSLEWTFPGSEFTGETFYKVYTDMSKLENNIIDFDLKNLNRVLFPDKPKDESDFTATQRPSTVGGGKSLNLELVAQRIRAHYIDSSRVIKRCFGNVMPDDFQTYNWGITLTADMSLPEDKAEFLMNLYGKAFPKRISKPEFELIMNKHTTYKEIIDPHSKNQKWLDILASWKIHEVFMKGFAPTIGQRQLVTIIRVNELEFQLNFPMITRDMAKLDKYCNKLHVTLVEDPCLSNDPDRFKNSIAQRKIFEKSIKEEEVDTVDVTKEIRAEAEEKMRIEFEKEKIREHQRALKRNSMAAERQRVKEIDDKLKEEKLLRLREIKRQREELEQCKIELYLMSNEEKTSQICRVVWNKSYNNANNLRKIAPATEKKSDDNGFDSIKDTSTLEHIPAIPLTDEERERQEILELMKNYRLSKEEDMKRNRMELQAVIEKSLSKGRFSASNLVGKEIEQIRAHLKDLDADEEGSMNAAGAGAKSNKFLLQTEKKNNRPKLDPLEKFFINKYNKPIDSKGDKELDEFQKSVAEFWAAEEGKNKNNDKDKDKNSSTALDYDSPNDSPGECADKLKGDWISLNINEKMGLNDRDKIEETRLKHLKEEEERVALLIVLEAKKRRKEMEAEERRKGAAAELEASMSEKEKQKKERHDRQLEYYRLQKLEEATRVELEAKEKKDREDEMERKRLQKIQELKDFEDQLKQKKIEKAAKVAANLSNLKSTEDISRKSLLTELQKYGESAKAEKEKKEKEAKSKKAAAAAEKISSFEKKAAADDSSVSSSMTPNTKSTTRGVSPDKDKLVKNKAKNKKKKGSPGKKLDDLEGEVPTIDMRPIEDVDVTGDFEEQSMGSAYGLEDEGKEGEVLEGDVLEGDVRVGEQPPVVVESPGSKKSSRNVSPENNRIRRELASPGSGNPSPSRKMVVAKPREFLPEGSENNNSGSNHDNDTTNNNYDGRSSNNDNNDYDNNNNTSTTYNNSSSSSIDGDNNSFEKHVEKIGEYIHEIQDKGHFDGDIEPDYESSVHYGGDRQLDMKLIASGESPGYAEEEEFENEYLDEEEIARIAAAKAEKMRKEKEEADRIAAENAEMERLAKEESEREKPIDIDMAFNLIADINIPEIADDEMAEDEEAFQIITHRTQNEEFEGTPSGENSFNDDYKDDLAYVHPEMDSSLNISRQSGDEEEDELKVIRDEDNDKSVINVDEIPSLRSIDVEMPSIIEQQDFTNLIFSDYSFMVEKTEGELRIIIRHDDRGDFHGLFIHGFKPNSKAERQNMLQIGDELLTLNNMIVEGCHLEDVKEALLDHIGDSIPMTIRRREGLDLESFFPSVVNVSAKMDSARQKLSPRLYHIKEHADADLDLDADVEKDKDLEVPQNSFPITIPYSIPKTHGELRVIIRHDDKGDEHGLYVHGFKPHSKAERQGKLRIGDELVVINGVSVEGGFLEDVVDAMFTGESSDPDSVDVIIKRHVTMEEYMKVMSAAINPDAHKEEHEAEMDAKYEVVEEHKLHEQESFKVQKLNLDNLKKELLQIKSADELEEIPYEDIAVEVEKVDKELKLIVRHDDWGSIHGLFIHGFKPGCRAENVLQVGDEIISANKISLEQKFLEDLAVVLKNHAAAKITLIIRRRVWSLLKNVPSSSRNPFTFRSPMTPKFTALKALENMKLFEIKADEHKHARRPSFAPSIEELRQVTSSIVEGDIMKTNGELRVHIRFDDEGTHHGLFVHGFKPNSNAEKQGIIRVGDELIKINNKFVKGKFLEDVIEVMQGHIGDTIPMTVQRYDVHKIYPDYKPPEMLKKQAKAEERAKKNSDDASADSRSVATSVDKVKGGDFNDAASATGSLESAGGEGNLNPENNMFNDSNTDENGSKTAGEGGVESVKTPEPEISLDDLADYGVDYVPEAKIEKKKFTDEDFETTFKERIEASLEVVLTNFFEDECSAFFKDKEIFSYVYEDRPCKVPKTNGELRMHVKHRKDENGLFIHSFKPNSRAEKLGVVKVGDEIIEIEGELVMGYSIEQLVSIFKSHKGATVNMVVRRKLHCMLYGGGGSTRPSTNTGSR